MIRSVTGRKKYKKELLKDIVRKNLDDQSRFLKEEIDSNIMSDVLLEVGWVQVKISISWSDMTAETISYMKDWCDENTIGRHYNKGKIWLFEYQQDAVVFALRWS